MQLTRYLLATGCAAAIIAVSGTKAEAAACAPATADPVQTIRDMYAAATAGDRAKTLAAFAPGAYLFDGGERFTPEGITDQLLKIEAAGTKPLWHVEESESHASCDIAWATWTNRGSFTTASAVTPRVWLESAVFEWRGGAWKVRFFQSTAVSAKP